MARIDRICSNEETRRFVCCKKNVMPYVHGRAKTLGNGA